MRVKGGAGGVGEEFGCDRGDRIAGKKEQPLPEMEKRGVRKNEKKKLGLALAKKKGGALILCRENYL